MRKSNKPQMAQVAEKCQFLKLFKQSNLQIWIFAWRLISLFNSSLAKILNVLLTECTPCFKLPVTTPNILLNPQVQKIQLAINRDNFSCKLGREFSIISGYHLQPDSQPLLARECIDICMVNLLAYYFWGFCYQLS